MPIRCNTKNCVYYSKVLKMFVCYILRQLLSSRRSFLKNLIKLFQKRYQLSLTPSFIRYKMEKKVTYRFKTQFTIAEKFIFSQLVDQYQKNKRVFRDFCQDFFLMISRVFGIFGSTYSKYDVYFP